MATDLRAALERARDWERHHVPRVPRPRLSRSSEERVADAITAFAGSMTFVMIAQNRLPAQADARAQADYEVNLRAEAEIARLIHLVEALVQHDIARHPPAVEPPPS
jgi:uncharacterized membrane protein